MKELKPIQTRDLDLELAEPQLTPPRRGPQTGVPVSPSAYVTANATAAEWTKFAAVVQKRKSKEPAVRHWRCNHCGFTGVFRGDAQPSNCLKCNWPNRVNGGRLVEMTAAEVAAWKTEQAAATAAEVGRQWKSAWIARNAERAKDGQPPVSFAAFVKEQNDRYRRSIEQDRTLGDAYMARPKGEEHV